MAKSKKSIEKKMFFPLKLFTKFEIFRFFLISKNFQNYPQQQQQQQQQYAYSPEHAAYYQQQYAHQQQQYAEHYGRKLGFF